MEPHKEETEDENNLKMRQTEAKFKNLIDE